MMLTGMTDQVDYISVLIRSGTFWFH